MLATSIRRAAVASLVAACFAAPAWAQTVGTPSAAGVNPYGVTINPITNKVYVANAGTRANNGTDSTITIHNGATGAIIGTLPGSAWTQWIAANIETGNVFASGLLGTHTKVIGPNDTEIADFATSNAGWTALDPWSGRAYVIRYGDSDEFNWLTDSATPSYDIASATRSLKPTSLAYNPVTQTLYMVHELTGDVVAMDTSAGPTPYPTLKCPSTTPGQYAAQPTAVPLPVPQGYVDPWNNASNPPSSYKMHPCIDVPDTPKWVAVNPVTNKAYTINDGTTTQVSVIDGANFNHFTNITVAGATGGRVIAVNPVTNKVHALFANGVATIDGATGNVQNIVPTGPAVAIGINTFTNRAYVASDDGHLYVLNGADGSLIVTLNIASGAQGIAVNPLTNTVYVTDTNGHVTPVSGAAGETVSGTGITTSITTLASNTGGPSGTITLNASSSFAAAPLNAIRRVYFRIDGGAWQLASGSGPYTAAYNGLGNGAHTIEAFATNGMEAPSANTDVASVPVFGNIASYGFNVTANGSAATVGLSRTSIDFGGQSMNTTSQPETVTVTNTGGGTLTISGIAVTGAGSGQFSQTNNCTSLGQGATCTISVTFTPAVVSSAALNSSTPVAASVTISSNAASSPDAVTLAGQAEKSLVTHFYRSILQRAAEPSGKAFWMSETDRVVGLGSSVNEAWYALAMTFYSSQEYINLARTDDGYVTDLYLTFFNRAPDDSGKAFWMDMLSRGMPREVLLAQFMFGPEFANFTQTIFGNTTVRAELDMTGDFYRGLMGRLADSGGFQFWLSQFRSAQCQGAEQVRAAADSISSQFLSLPEYTSRNRTNAQFVGDLYNAFLRLGGDLDGSKFWIGLLDNGQITRDGVRRQFLTSPEFSGRVQNVINQGCQK